MNHDWLNKCPVLSTLVLAIVMDLAYVFSGDWLR